MTTELGTFLKELRGNRSLRDVAKATGLSHVYIRQIELGEHPSRKTPVNPTFDALQGLSNYYGIPIEVLTKKASMDKGSKPAETDSFFHSLTGQEYEMLKLFERLDDSMKNHFLEILRKYQK